MFWMDIRTLRARLEKIKNKEKHGIEKFNIMLFFSMRRRRLKNLKFFR